MTDMQKMTATWSGFTGAPGTTTIYFNGNSTQSPQLLHDFFEAIKAYLNTTTTIQVNNSGEKVDPATGKVTGLWTGAAQAATVGTATGQAVLVAQGPQCRIDTGQFRRGKHIYGRFYLIPIANNCLQTNGILSPTAQTTILNALTTLNNQSGGALGVFHRPVYDYTVKPPVLKTPGEFLSAQTLVVPTKMAVLTSRRD